MSKHIRLFSIIALLLVPMLIFGCKKKDDGKIRLTVWGISTGEHMKGVEAAMKEFERQHPNIKVVALTIGTQSSAGVGNARPQQKLLTSIVGGVPPDVLQPDGYTVNDWASRDAFEPLDELIASDRDGKYGIKLENYYKRSIEEVTYNGKIYAIPYNGDGPIMYWNKKLFREAGLDPEKPPRTWSELLELGKKLTVKDKKGNLERVGYIPFQGNAGLTYFIYANNGYFLSEDGTKSDIDNPRNLEALKYVVNCYDELGGAKKLSSFQASFRTDALDPFILGQVAITTNTPSLLEKISRFAPDLDFGTAPIPVPDDRYYGRPPFENSSRWMTWAGGFTFSIPRGAKHKKEAWEFIKWMTSPEGMEFTYRAQREYNNSIGRTFIARYTPNMVTNEIIAREFAPVNPKFRKAMDIFREMQPLSKGRPVTFICARLYHEVGQAANDGIFHIRTPEGALQYRNNIVQKEMDKFFARQTYPILNWKYPIAIVILLVLIGILIARKRLKEYGPIGTLSRSETKAGFFFASPWMLGFLTFTIGPIIASVIFSFCDYDVIHPARWVGLLNYKDLLGIDWGIFSKTLTNAGFLAIFGLPLGLTLSLSVAMLLNTKVLGMTWYRTIYYLPSIVPSVANAILWVWVLSPEYGLINTFWRATITQWFGINAPLWMAAPESAKPALVLMGLWGAGGGMILWLAGLQGVPQHLYEAADIDGAGWWSKFKNVTMPMLSPYIFFNLIMGTIHVLQQFETIFIMTGGEGGPAGNATLVPVLYLFNNAFMYFKMGYASAIAWLLFAIIMTLTFIQLKLAPRWVHYEGEKR